MSFVLQLSPMDQTYSNIHSSSTAGCCCLWPSHGFFFATKKWWAIFYAQQKTAQKNCEKKSDAKN
ncbi:MAG: hypothetical protein M0Z50_09305 [Planctomycetia bacterium]|nr:hypothetical protein [Planctomycetia bacterium]